MAKRHTDTMNPTDTTDEVKHGKARRAERNRLVAKLGEMGSPWASGAALANVKVNKLEDELANERTTLMAILRHAKVVV
jgi:hypothetical protein